VRKVKAKSHGLFPNLVLLRLTFHIFLPHDYGFLSLVGLSHKTTQPIAN